MPPLISTSRLCTIVLSAFFVLALTGCGLGPVAPPSASAGVSITGKVHGGQQPLVGAHVFLFAANTSGWGGKSVSLLKNVNGSTTLDGDPDDVKQGDYYVTTGTDGGFTITGDYTCTAGQQVYLYAVGGNPSYPSGSSNSAAGLLAALGTCPSTDSFSSSTYVFMDEVSTIATAYALAGFATDAVHVADDEGVNGNAYAIQAKAGMANAFANVTNLESLSTGTALATTPAGNGTVPQTTINTLANILAACINSTGPNSTGCATIFNNIKSGGATGTTATDTATAAIYIAQHPGTSVAALYGNATASGPFQPSLAGQPNDFTIGITFTSGSAFAPYAVAIDAAGNAWIANYDGTNSSVFELSSLGATLSGTNGYTGGGLDFAAAIAIDNAGDAWIANYAGNSLSKFSSSGTALSPTSGYTGGGIDEPQGIAIDGLGDVWVVSGQDSTLSKFSSSGTALSGTGYTGGGMASPNGLGVDGSGNIWIASATVNSSTISEFSNSGIPISSSGYSGGGLYSPRTAVIDSSGNVWAPNLYGSSVTELSNAGAYLSGSTGYTGAGISYPYAAAIDGSGDVWIPSLVGSVSELSNTGAALSPSTGYSSTPLSTPVAIATDGSGDVWVISRGNESLVELIGAATPVITPICAGLPATPTSNGSSRLGTKP